MGPIQSQESLRIETLLQLWLVGDALKQGAERCHAAGFEHGGRGPWAKESGQTTGSWKRWGNRFPPRTFVNVLASKLCLTFCDPMDCSLLGSSVHRVFQARVLEWVAIPSSRGSSWPRNWTSVSCISYIAGRFFYPWATRKAQKREYLF